MKRTIHQFLVSLIIFLLLYGSHQTARGLTEQQSQEGHQPKLKTFEENNSNSEVSVESQKQIQNALDRFTKEIGYDPRDYQIRFKIIGDNLTIFSSSYWIKMQVKPEDGIVQVIHQTVIRDKFWGTFQYYDHPSTSVKFTVDPNYCRAVFQLNSCTFTGTEALQLPNFINNHQIIKNGKWEIVYIESGKELTYSFRFGYNDLPKGVHDEVTIKEINQRMCQIFPDGLLCPKVSLTDN